MTCSCQFTIDNIVDESLSCRTSQYHIVYRAKVNLQVPVLEMDASDIVEIISSWVQTAPTITVSGFRVTVDPSCPTKLESDYEENCFVMSTTTTSSTLQRPLPSVQPSSPNEDNSKSSVAIVVGAIVAGVIVIVLIVVIFVITTLHCKLKSNYR